MRVFLTSNSNMWVLLTPNMRVFLTSKFSEVDVCSARVQVSTSALCYTYHCSPARHPS